MANEPGPPEKALQAMREAKIATEEVRRKSASARDKAEIGAALVERVKAAEKKRGKVRNSKSLTRRPQKGKS
jgi:hypothetical protein